MNVHAVSTQGARAALVAGKLGLVGPLKLDLASECPECGSYFVARLPVFSETHTIKVEGTSYPRWGVVSALFHWEALLEKTHIQEVVDSGFEFQLIRTDNFYKTVERLAESEGFGSKKEQVSTFVETANISWEIKIKYDPPPQKIGLIVLSILGPFFIACLVCVVLVQKQVQTAMRGESMAQEAKVDIERNMTAYFAHGKCRSIPILTDGDPFSHDFPPFSIRTAEPTGCNRQRSCLYAD